MSYHLHFKEFFQSVYAEALFTKWFSLVQENIPKDSAPFEKEQFLKLQVLTYLFPFYCYLGSPFNIAGVREGVTILKEWYRKNQGKICLFADSDADGISAAAIFYLFLRDILKVDEKEIVFLTPGHEDKFGIGEKFAQEILKINPALLITFDCGSTDIESLAFIKKNLKTKIIILDHHTLNEAPPVDALIHPLCSLPQSRHFSTSVLSFHFVRGFLESLTPHYEKIYEIEENKEKFFLQDGVFLKDIGENKTTTVSWDGPTDIKLKNYWEVFVKKDSELFKINQILEKNPYFLNLADRFLLLQNSRRKKNREKLHFALFYAAIGVVSDLVPLWTDNRIILYQTLRLLPQVENSLLPGFRELLRRLDLLRPYIEEQDFAFYLCPTINAADRMGNPHLAFHVLTEKDPLKGARFAYELYLLNQKRKTVVKEALEIIEKNPETLINESVVVAYHQELHRGISGLLASRLAESFQRPAIVLVDDGGSLRGSMRSYGGKDVFAFLSKVSFRFTQFGGHRQALGFSLPYEEKDNFLKEVSELSQEFFAKEMPDLPLSEDKVYFTFWDYEITSQLWKELLLFAPYGKGNPLPEVTIINSERAKVEVFGSDKNHLRVILPINPQIELVWFFAPKLDLKEELSYAWTGEPSWVYYQGKLLPRLKLKKVKPWQTKL